MAAQDRVVSVRNDWGAPERDTLFRAAAAAPGLGTYRVAVPRKSGPSGQIISPARVVALEIRAQQLQLRPGGKRDAGTVWVIQAREVEVPPGQEPIHWVLLTTEQVPDLETACRMVYYYSRRWVIERLHYTLKSGLRAERLQIDDARSLGHALTVYYVVAWRLLHLTYLARERPEQPAGTVLEADELAVLQRAAKRAVETVREAVLAIAELGGWQRYRTAPPPGVKSLWVGWITLRGMVQGYRLALGGSHREI